MGCRGFRVRVRVIGNEFTICNNFNVVLCMFRKDNTEIN